MFRLCKGCAVSALLAALAGLGAVSGTDEPGKLPPELESVLSLAMAAPPEIAASGLLRMSPLVSGQPARRHLIEMAFRLAAKARYPVRLVSYPGTEADTRTGSLSRALNLKLDALSLESRAVQEMVAEDPGRARELFAAMTRPALSSLGCEASLLPDVAPYYEAAVAVARSPLPGPAKADYPDFATKALTGATAIAEFGPAGYALASLDLSRQHFEPALRAFAAKLESASVDNRSFQFFSHTIDAAVAFLVDHARQVGASPDTLIASYRRFLVAQYHGVRCVYSGSQAPLMLSSSLFGEAIRGNRPPIGSEEMVPIGLDRRMDLNPYWRTEEAQKIRAAFPNFQQGAGAAPPSVQARQLTDFLRILENWWSSETTEEDYYHQKAALYEALLDAVPGTLDEHAIDSFVGFLGSSTLPQRDPVQWFSHVRSAVSRVPRNQPDRGARILAAYRSSSNIVLRLEALLDQVAPMSP